MKHLNTDAGRARAWIRLAMNENMLESYLAVLQQDRALIREYYAPQSFFHDSERVGILVTLIGGIGNIRFAMHVDDPSLNDLGVFPLAAGKTTKGEEEEKNISIAFLGCLIHITFVARRASRSAFS